MSLIFTIIKGTVMKRICILGSTGSIGTQALRVCENLTLPVAGLTAAQNVELLAAQAVKYRPEKVCIFDNGKYKELKSLLENTNIEVLAGMEGLCALAEMEYATVLNAVVGMVGLTPTVSAIRAGNPVALANKETLVAGGAVVMRLAEEKNVPVLPVDSEHSAIFQCLQGNRAGQVKRLILTASGGPFFGKTRKELEHVTAQQALCHPNWSMGAKVTIDSATLMNKGLEIMEACWLFHRPPEDIDILVHRESVIHSMVEYADHSVMAQMGVPDMKLPIQYALTYPDRLPCEVERLALAEIGRLTFALPDEETFRCLPACKEAMRRGGLYPAIVNGANEEAVRLFLKGKIGFLQIGELVEKSLILSGATEEITVENVIEADRMAREFILSQIA